MVSPPRQPPPSEPPCRTTRYGHAGALGACAGLISGLAGHYEANPLLAGGVAIGASAAGNYLLYQR